MLKKTDEEQRTGCVQEREIYYTTNDFKSLFSIQHNKFENIKVEKHIKEI